MAGKTGKALKPSPMLPQPLVSPRATCPFSGRQLEVVPVTTTVAGHPVTRYQVRGYGWVGTGLYQTPEQALWFFSHNEGLTPLYPNPFTAVKVRELEAPEPNEAADRVADAERAAEAIGDEMAGEFKDKKLST